MNLGVINTNGQIVASALPLAELDNQADRALVRRVRKTRAFAMGDYLTGLPKGKPAVTFGCPVFDTSGRVQAVVLAWTGLDSITRPGSALATNVPGGASWTVIRPNGIVLARYPAAWPPSGQPFPNRDLVKSASTQPEGIVEALSAQGVRSFYSFQPLDSPLVPGKCGGDAGYSQKDSLRRGQPGAAAQSGLDRHSPLASPSRSAGWAAMS